MTANKNMKLKILYLLKIFREETDEDHGLTMSQLISRLAAYGVDAERKSIYSDIAALRDFDIAIKMDSDKNPPEYALARPDFSLGELMLMVDAIESCRAITAPQADLLVRNVKTLANNFEQDKLDRRIHVVGRIKSENDSVFGSIDRVHEAIRRKCQISFRYSHRAPEGIPELAPACRLHIVTPLAIVYDEGFYYLTGWDRARDSMAEFRIDRMDQVFLTRLPAKENDEIRSYRYEEGVYRSFGRFKGRKATATLSVRPDKAEIIMDTFGDSAHFTMGKDGLLLAKVKVYESDQFFGWVASMGTMVGIIAPAWLVKDWRAFLKKLLAASGEKDA